MAVYMTLADHLRANAALLDMLVRRPGQPPSKKDLAGLVADMLRQASEAEELQALAAPCLRSAA